MAMTSGLRCRSQFAFRHSKCYPFSRPLSLVALPRQFPAAGVSFQGVRTRRPINATIAVARKQEEGFSPSSLVGPVAGAVATITSSLVKVLPASVSRGVVELGVKGGLVLLVLSFARSVISLVLTIGTVVAALFIASKVLGGDDDDDDDGGRGSRPATSNGTAGRPPSKPAIRLPGLDLDDDLAEVWYDEPPLRWRQQRRAPSQRRPRPQPPQLLLPAQWEDRQSEHPVEPTGSIDPPGDHQWQQPHAQQRSQLWPMPQRQSPDQRRRNSESNSGGSPHQSGANSRSTGNSGPSRRGQRRWMDNPG